MYNSMDDDVEAQNREATRRRRSDKSGSSTKMKLLYALVALILLAGIGFAIYWGVTHKSKKPKTTPEPIAVNATTQPPQPPQPIRKQTTQPPQTTTTTPTTTTTITVGPAAARATTQQPKKPTTTAIAKKQVPVTTAAGKINKGVNVQTNADERIPPQCEIDEITKNNLFKQFNANADNIGNWKNNNNNNKQNGFVYVTILHYDKEHDKLKVGSKIDTNNQKRKIIGGVVDKPNETFKDAAWRYVKDAMINNQNENKFKQDNLILIGGKFGKFDNFDAGKNVKVPTKDSMSAFFVLFADDKSDVSNIGLVDPTAITSEWKFDTVPYPININAKTVSANPRNFFMNVLSRVFECSN